MTEFRYVIRGRPCATDANPLTDYHPEIVEVRARTLVEAKEIAPFYRHPDDPGRDGEIVEVKR